MTTFNDVLNALRAQARSPREKGTPDALIRLIGRVTYLSVQTMRIVDNLPPALGDG